MIKKLGFDKYSAFYLALLFLLIFGITKHDTFLSTATFKLVTQENIIIGILALAFLVPLSTGTYDLSVPVAGAMYRGFEQMLALCDGGRWKQARR